MISNLDEDEDIELIWWYIYKKNIKNICLNKYIYNIRMKGITPHHFHKFSASESSSWSS